jgi:hypothetical protein
MRGRNVSPKAIRWLTQQLDGPFRNLSSRRQLLARTLLALGVLTGFVAGVAAVRSSSAVFGGGGLLEVLLVLGLVVSIGGLARLAPTFIGGSLLADGCLIGGVVIGALSALLA